MKKIFLLLFMLNLAFCDDANENVIDEPKEQQKLETSPDEDFYYNTRFTLGGFYHYQEKTTDKHRGTFFGEADVLIPIFQSSRTLFFIDLRGLDFEGRPIEGNFGLGLRHIFENYNWMFGVYSFYDRKRSLHSNFFNQITAGLEVKTKRFTFDANAYIPFGKTRRLEGTFGNAELRPGVSPFQNIWFGEGFEVALWGLDGEVGYNIWKGFSLFAGGFYFHRDNVETVAGPMARMYYAFDFANSKKAVFDKIILEAGGFYDHIHKWRYYAGVKISWVFGEEKKQKPKGLAKRMTEYVRRDYEIVTNGDDGGIENFERLNKSDGSPVNVQLVSDLAGLNQATGNGADVIGVLTTIVGTNGTSILADGQTITGKDYFFGNNMSIQLSEGGQIHSNKLQVTNDTTIRDLTLTDLIIENGPLSAPHIGDLKIDNTIFDSSEIIMDIDANDSGVSNIYVDNCQFKNIANDAIWLHNINNGTLNIKSFTNNVINATASGSGHIITILLGALGGKTTSLSIDNFSNNIITVDTGGNADVAAVDIKISAGGGLSNITETAAFGTIANNRIEIKGGNNQHMPFGIQTIMDGAGTSVTQTTTIQNISNNTFIVSAGNTHVGLVISNKEAASSGTQITTVGTITNNQIQIGAGTGNTGLFLGGDIQSVSTTSDLKVGEAGGGFGNTISLGATSTEAIRIFNNGSTSTLEIKVNDGGKDLSDANDGANVVKAGGNQGGITITP